MDNSVKGHMTSPHYDSDRLRSLDYDSKTILEVFQIFKFQKIYHLFDGRKTKEAVSLPDEFFFSLYKIFSHGITKINLLLNWKNICLKEAFTVAFIISEKIIQFFLLSKIIWNVTIM